MNAARDAPGRHRSQLGDAKHETVPRGALVVHEQDTKAVLDLDHQDLLQRWLLLAVLLEAGACRGVGRGAGHGGMQGARVLYQGGLTLAEL
jgi:hypothetical protein